jgi:hypothetical protein
MTGGKRRVARILALIVIIDLAFYAGTRHQKHREEIRAFLKGLISPSVESQAAPVAPPAPPAPPVRVEASAAPALPDLRSSRKLGTTLLPLVIETVVLPPEIGIHADHGGITVINGSIVVLDQDGALFKVEARGEHVDRLPLPVLPNNAHDYVQFARKPIKIDGGFEVDTGFVTHDVESRTEAAGIRLFVSYERYLRERGTTALVVSSIVVDPSSFEPTGSWEDLYVGQPLAAEWYSGVAGGGRMLVRGDDLYLTVGDYNQDNVFMSSRLEAQRPDNDFGKILKIDLRTKIKSIVSIGHRNPQGLTATSSGTIYATEHGPRGGDELNAIVDGRNYGWPVTTLGTHYTTYDWPNHGDRAQEQGFEPPVFAWLPSIGVSNLMEVENFDPAWDGDLLVTSLKAQSVYRLRRDGSGRIVYSEPILLDHRLRDIAALPDGTVVLWTDDARLLFLNVDHAAFAANRRAPG